MPTNGTTTKGISIYEFLIGFLSLVLAVLFILHGFSLTADIKPHTVAPSSSEFEKCFDGDKSDHLVDNDIRVVLMVIDAWRMSFLSDSDSPMTFLRQSIISGQAIAFTANAQTPTVTMPRMKALTSGVVPSLITLLGNFFASENTEDSWITSASSTGRRIAFFGDDTWIRLFPNAFIEAEGVTSFFVNDYTEVDNNVTRHLDIVLNKPTWDVLILHYLGLDHIGHSLGGESPQLKKKLREMDDIAKRIYDVASARSPLLLVVVGDHGMTSGGSHGGGSDAETKVPMLFLHSKAKIIQGGNIEGLMTAEQVDLASTLPFFLHVPIPSGSIGLTLLPQFASQWQISDSTLFSAAFQSAVHFSRFTDGTSIVALSDVHGDERCQIAKTFVAHARGRLAMEENRKAQQKVIQSQEQALRWPIFVSLAFIALSFILFSGAYQPFISGVIESWITGDSSELPLYSVYLVFALYHLSSYSTSLIEEEHDIWYYITPTVILYRIFIIAGLPTDLDILLKMFYSNSRFRNGFVLLCLHRWAMSFTSHTRRRWSMRQDLLPLPIFPEFRFSIPVLDSLTTDLNLTAIARWMPSTTAIVCVSYLLMRIRPKNFASGVMTFTFVLSGAICMQSYLNDSKRWLITYFIIGGVLITLLSSVPLGAMLYLSYLVRPEALPLLIISFEMGFYARKLSSSPYLFTFLCQTVFFYAGQSSNISSIDIAAGYKGLSSYNMLLVGFQILVNFYAMPLSFSLGYL
ncbi:hypothetical protein V3C99_011022 [Haemonchus contortus]